MKRRAVLTGLLALAACGSPPRLEGDESQRMADLARDILALGEGVDREEAARAARVTFNYTRQLVVEYGITDPPLIHNTKVNMGLRPRGLCYHWAEDIEARLKQEGFLTLDLHRAIAPATALRIEHSTAVISRKGDSLYDGLVLDPWRTGGVVYWAPVRADTRYAWRPREEVLEKRRQELAAAP